MKKPAGMLNKPSKKDIRLALAGLFCLVVALWLTGRTFFVESRANRLTFGQNITAESNWIDAHARILSIDPVKGDMSVRLAFFPHGAYVDQHGNLTSSIQLDVYGDSILNNYHFKQGDRMEPVDVNLTLFNGELMNYPFDTHEAEMALVLTTVCGSSSPENASSPACGAGDMPGDEKGIPFRLLYDDVLAGYTNTTRARTDFPEQTGVVDLRIQTTRSLPVKAFAVMIMVLQWLIALVTVIAIWVWVARKNKIEVTMFGWLGALLFALIPLRNAMPGIPGIGTFSDYVSFFWAVAVVTLCMVAAVCTWAFYRAKPE